MKKRKNAHELNNVRHIEEFDSSKLSLSSVIIIIIHIIIIFYFF